MRLFWIIMVVGLNACSQKGKEAAKQGAADAPGQAETPAKSAGEATSLAAVESVAISPQQSKRGESLTAQVNDSKNRVLYFTWIVNGEEVSGQHTDRLPGEYVVKGAKIAVRVTPKTEGDDGADSTSAEIVVGNTAPRISSFDLVSSADNKVVLQTKTEDVDGDSLVIRLVSGPAGMDVNASGEVHWTAPADFAQEVTFSVGASDGVEEYILNGSVGSK